MNLTIKPAPDYNFETIKNWLKILTDISMIFKKPLRLLLCLVVFGMLPSLTVAFASPGAGAIGTLPRAGETSADPLVKNKKNNLLVNPPAKLASLTRLLRLKLFIDAYNYDDIAIGFNAGASQLYNADEDSRYLHGLDAIEGLSCYSSDGVPLSVDLLPLPNQTEEVIRLDVETQGSRTLTLTRTEFDSIPKNYRIWLVDKYKKDSLDLRVDSNYVFKIDKMDSATFGCNRFEVIIRRDAPAPLKLIGFNALKQSGGAQITWTTENEANYTNFAVERSSDNGLTFNIIDTLISTATGTYGVLDKAPPVAADQYRLKMQDLNGVISYSNIVTLIFSAGNSIASAGISIYPNPANGFINLTVNTNSSGTPNIQALQNIGFEASFSKKAIAGTSSYGIKILNITGYVIKTATSSTPAWQGDVANLVPGTYIVQVVNYSNNSLVGRSTFIKL